MAHDKQQRVNAANEIIKVIAAHGRKFFSYQGDNPNTPEPERISRFEIRGRGQLWFIDKFRERPIYVAYRGHWNGFSEGGTLRDLVCAMTDWINGKKDLEMWRFGPWPQHICDGDLWGYGESMEAVRSEVTRILSSESRA